LPSSSGLPTKIVAIGGSAGAIEALRHVVRHLPADFPAAICVVVHISPDSPGLIPSIFEAVGDLPAQHAEHNGKLESGRIYVAPPDHHLLVHTKGHTLLGVGPKENLFRPAVDPLFRSAALAYGSDCIGVILSGGLDDGVAGLAAIKNAGGIAIVQQPEEAIVSSMPQAALKRVVVDHCLSTEAIAAKLDDLVRRPAARAPISKDTEAAMEIETRIAAGADPGQFNLEKLGSLSNFTCPDCAGVLRMMDGEPLRFRCHTGHAHSGETLAYAYRKRSDDALWAAFERVREEAMFLSELAANSPVVDRVEGPTSKVTQTEALAEQIRNLITRSQGTLVD
jgi:two-component system, chemotaxis family, protein-glutamate methylesterase/glutaminase